MVLTDIIFPLIATTIAVISLLISLYSFWRESPSSVQKRRMKDKVKEIYERARVLIEQTTLAHVLIKKGETSEDPYFRESVQLNFSRMERALDEAINLGLSDVFIPEDIPDSLSLHTAYIQGLVNFSEEERPNITDIVQKEHLLFGNFRIYGIAVNYLNSHGEKIRITDTHKKLIKESWTYIRNLTPSSENSP